MLSSSLVVWGQMNAKIKYTYMEHIPLAWKTTLELEGPLDIIPTSSFYKWGNWGREQSLEIEFKCPDSWTAALPWQLTVCVSYLLLLANHTKTEWLKTMMIDYLSQFCLVEQFCCNGVDSLMQQHSSGQLAGGWAHLHSWCGWTFLLAWSFIPRFFTSGRSQGRDPRQQVPSVQALIKPLLALFTDVPPAKANHMVKVRMKLEEECTKVWISRAWQIGGYCCKNLPCSLWHHCSNSDPYGHGVLKNVKRLPLKKDFSGQEYVQ